MSNMLHWIYSVVLQRIVCPTDFWISLVFLYKIDQNLNKWIIAEIMKKTTVKHVTVSKTSNSLLLYIVDKIDNDFFFFLSVRQILFIKLMYYRYEIMEVLITNRSEKTEIKVNPSFYLPLETILRFYFVQGHEKRGSVRQIYR